MPTKAENVLNAAAEAEKANAERVRLDRENALARYNELVERFVNDKPAKGDDADSVQRTCYAVQVPLAKFQERVAAGKAALPHLAVIEKQKAVEARLDAQMEKRTALVEKCRKFLAEMIKDSQEMKAEDSALFTEINNIRISGQQIAVTMKEPKWAEFAACVADWSAYYGRDLDNSIRVTETTRMDVLRAEFNEYSQREAGRSFADFVATRKDDIRRLMESAAASREARRNAEAKAKAEAVERERLKSQGDPYADLYSAPIQISPDLMVLMNPGR